MQYQLVYDIQQIGYPHWWILAIGIFVISIGIAFFAFRNKPSVHSMFDSSDSKGIPLPYAAVVFGSLLFVVGLLNYSNFAELRNAFTEGHDEVVEGQVKEFVPIQRHRGQANESFVVNGYRFSYSHDDLTKGFNQTRSRGGPIREGLQVRIAHVDGSIVKLEIAKQ